MRFSALFAFVLLLTTLLTAGLPARAQSDDPNGALPPDAAARDDVKFAPDDGPMYIRVQDFRVTEVQPTGKADEYALTLLALTLRGEPDQRVLGGILFDIDGKSTVVPFQQGGVGDVIVTAPAGADRITVRAVDSNVTHAVELPGAGHTPWLLGGGGLAVIIMLLIRRRRQAALRAPKE